MNDPCDLGQPERSLERAKAGTITKNNPPVKAKIMD